MTMHTEPHPQSHLVELPTPIDSFSSVGAYASPFQTLLAFLARETQAKALTFANVQVPPHVYAALREATKRWAKAKHRAAQLDDLSAPGLTAPAISTRVPSFHALVEVAHVG